MAKAFKACRKSEGTDGKTYWEEAGLKLLVGEWEGRPSYTIIDGRSGEKFACFPIEKRQGGGERRDEGQRPPLNDDVPF